MKIKHIAWLIFGGLVMGLAACGGSSGPVPTTGSAGGTAASGASADAVSSGAITAFGSVFVNGHEFYTVGATVIDDDSDSASTSTSNLEVGEVVDVVSASNSSDANPIASELHVDPLARGYVDSSDATAGTVTVMGQTIQITSDTLFSDHRACISSTTNPCTSITDQSGLTATSGSGESAVPGTFVTVSGYLFADGSSTNSANIVATLISVTDAPTSSTTGMDFKAEGMITAANGSSITIGGLSIDLSSAQCYVSGRQEIACASAFSIGQVVSAYGATAPSLPATAFVPDGARLTSKIPVNAPGTSVEIEGAVSSVTASPAAFVLRGVNVDASNLPAGTTLPVVGDIVRVLGTVASDGLSITATSITILHAAHSASYGFEGDVDNVVAGAAANTYVLTLLGQNISVTSDTRLADRSTFPWRSENKEDPAINPFNINTFQTYLAASASQHLVVYAQADADGNLTAQWVAIVPPSTTSGITGVVDASPAPFNSTITGTPSTFEVHGVAVSADPTAVIQAFNKQTATVAAGDQVVARGTFASGTLTVVASPSFSNEVVDFGVPSRHDLDEF